MPGEQGPALGLARLGGRSGKPVGLLELGTGHDPVAEYPPQQGRLPDSLLSLDEHSTADSGGQLGEQAPQHRQLVVTACEEIALRGPLTTASPSIRRSAASTELSRCPSMTSGDAADQAAGMHERISSGWKL